LGKCIYSADLQEHIIQELVTRFLDDLVGYFPFYGQGEINADLIPSRVALFIKNFQLIAPLFKHPSYKEEEEVRVVVYRTMNRAPIKFRSGALSIVPYMELENIYKATGDRMAPTSVTIKPAPNSEFVLKATKFFIEHLGYLETDVRVSSIPYREPLNR
jgi:hypothetical protein